MSFSVEKSNSKTFQVQGSVEKRFVSVGNVYNIWTISYGVSRWKLRLGLVVIAEIEKTD